MKNRVISNSIIYTICGLMLKCFNFFLLPLYSAYLTTADYGISNVSGSFITSMGFVVAFSLFAAVLRFYVDLKDEPEKLKRFYGTVSVFSLLSALLFMAVAIVFKDIWYRRVFSDVDFYPVVFVTLISLTFSCQHYIYENILRGQQRAWRYCIVTILYFVVNLSCNIVFVVNMKMGALGTIMSAMIANITYTLFFWADMIARKSITFCIDLKLLKSALKYSIPIIPHNLSTTLALLISMVLIGRHNSVASLGLYSVASQFGNMADVVLSYVNNAYGPWLFERLHDKDEGYKKTISSMASALCSIIGVFFVCLAFFSQDYILLFMSDSYAAAWRYIPLIVGVYTIKTAYYFYINILLYYKKASRWIFTSTLTTSFANIILSYVLIPRYGVYGSIAADALSMVARVLIIVFISMHYDDIGIRLRKFAVHFLVVSAIIFAGMFPSYIMAGNEFSVFNLLYKMVVLSVYLIILLIKYKDRLSSVSNKVKCFLHMKSAAK